MKRSALPALLLTLFYLSGCGAHPAELPETSLPAPIPTEEPVPEAVILVPPAPRPTEDILRDLLLDYGYYQEEAEPRVEELLCELTAADPAEGEVWREIVDCWRSFTREGLPTAAVPEGLPEDSSVCFVVLGYQLNADGTLRPELEGRLETALACAERYPRAHLLCTGGGTAAEAPTVTEAGQMVQWLTERGVERARILMEDGSLTTGQNAMSSYVLLRSYCPEVTSVVVVSSDYHVPWGAVLLEGEFRLAAARDGKEPLHVIAGAAFPAETEVEYPFAFQAAGLLELAGQGALAEEIYNGLFPTPPLL